VFLFSRVKTDMNMHPSSTGVPPASGRRDAAAFLFPFGADMEPRVLMGWITDHAYEEKYNIYAIAVHGERDGRLPTATVVTNKVDGKIAGHFVCVDEKAGKVKFFSGTYFDRDPVPLASAMGWFGREVTDCLSVYV